MPLEKKIVSLQEIEILYEHYARDPGLRRILDFAREEALKNGGVLEVLVRRP